MYHSVNEYERLMAPRLHRSRWGTDGLILQLHAWDVGHHHGPMADPKQRLGNGVLLWFEVDDFDHRELWITDPDGYTVVLAAHDGDAVPGSKA